MIEYRELLERKAQSGEFAGFDPVWMPDFLFPFQRSLVDWSLRKGKAAIFADCGTGKTPMQLVWAQNVIEKSNGRALILTPLAVAAQTASEAAKFGIPCHRSHDGTLRDGINIANYERLHLFKPEDFAGVVCDESSILKAFAGHRRRAITDFMRHVPYRLLCTATAAPNDFIELGTSSEALGQLGYMDMLARFFKNDQQSSNPKRNWVGGTKWRFKGHAEDPFWRWVCSWARAVRKPSDLGFDDDRFVLPEMIEREHIVKARTLAEGMLFSLPAVGLREQREERKRTIAERCEKAAALVDHGGYAVVWCHLNKEGDLLAKIIPGAVQVSGSDSDEAKERKFEGFSSGDFRVLIIKPKIGAFGLNWQHCAHMTFFPSHSFEQYYQGTRRCWRFGQRSPVVVDVIATEGERGVLESLKRKSAAASKMFGALVENMNDSLRIERGLEFTKESEVPPWLSTINS